MIPRTYSNRYTRKPKVRVKAMDQWQGWGWGIFFCQLMIAFGFLAFGLIHLAFANREPGDSNRAAYQQTLRAMVTVAKGNISYDNGVVKISDEYTGKTFTLNSASGVKLLWDAGVKYVSIEGHASGNTFNVENVSAP